MEKTANKVNVKRFEKMKDGWIKDNKTGLEWGKSSDKEMNWKDANAFCISHGGRLPSRTELETIQDLTVYNPCIDKKIFKDTISNYYWSATKCAWNDRAAWCVSFGSGRGDYYYEYDGSCVRPVRASQSV